VILFGLRRWTLNESIAEARLRSPDTHKVAYVVPDGQDPTVVMAALAHAGFTSVVDIEGGIERLLIECAEPDRVQVGSIIDGVRAAGIDGQKIRAGHVSFEDEAPITPKPEDKHQAVPPRI
jgi:hypothetical protein